VELSDALIAACASSHGRQLWTLDKKHYPMKDVRFFSSEAKRYFASGFGRIWNFTTFGSVPFPPSMCHDAYVA
jgi:hypothetical protein